jgi:hypothetical protein
MFSGTALFVRRLVTHHRVIGSCAGTGSNFTEEHSSFFDSQPTLFICAIMAENVAISSADKGGESGIASRLSKVSREDKRFLKTKAY